MHELLPLAARFLGAVRATQLLGACARLFNRFVETPARLVEAAQALRAGGAAREVEAQGSAANRGLADTLNALVWQRSQLQRDVARKVAEASHAIEQERSRLSALMAELTQAVLVCNLDGRILLYNSRARAQFRALSSTPSTAGGAEMIGPGRSIHAVFERQLVTHALDTLQQRAPASVAQPSTQFVASTRNGQLLRVQMAAVSDVPANSTVPAAGELQTTGFVLMFHDITRDFEQEAMRDRLLLGLTEGSRASLGNLQAAVEMLELPDLEAAMRERFQRVVRDEVATMTARVQTLAADVLAGMKTRWPMEEMLGADLVSSAARRIEAIGPVRVSTSDVDAALWLKIDSYSLLQALVYRAGRLVDEYVVKSLQLRLKAAGPRAQLDLVWSGQAMSTETVMKWQMDAMVLRNGTGADATPLTVRDVVERHGGEFWCERVRVRHEAFFRFLLPCSAGQDRPATAQTMPGDSRPEFYDFDLFQTSAQTRALDERPLAELPFTVFDSFLQRKEAPSGLRFDQPVLDTLLLSAWLHPNQASHRFEAIAERLGVTVTGRRTALGDARVTAEVLLRLIPLLRGKGVHTLGGARAAALAALPGPLEVLASTAADGLFKSIRASTVAQCFPRNTRFTALFFTWRNEVSGLHLSSSVSVQLRVRKRSGLALSMCACIAIGRGSSKQGEVIHGNEHGCGRIESRATDDGGGEESHLRLQPRHGVRVVRLLPVRHAGRHHRQAVLFQP